MFQWMEWIILIDTDEGILIEHEGWDCKSKKIEWESESKSKSGVMIEVSNHSSPPSLFW